MRVHWSAKRRRERNTIRLSSGKSMQRQRGAKAARLRACCAALPCPLPSNRALRLNVCLRLLVCVRRAPHFLAAESVAHTHLHLSARRQFARQQNCAAVAIVSPSGAPLSRKAANCPLCLDCSCKSCRIYRRRKVSCLRLRRLAAVASLLKRRQRCRRLCSAWLCATISLSCWRNSCRTCGTNSICARSVSR